MATEPPPDISGLSLHPPSFTPRDISLPLPLAPHTTLHIKLSALEKTTLVFLTSTDYSNSGTNAPLGSFVYALPNRFEPASPLCTALITVSTSIDFTSRVAKILARRTGKPIYVGSSVSFLEASVEEEIEGVKAAVDGALKELGQDRTKSEVGGV